MKVWEITTKAIFLSNNLTHVYACVTRVFAARSTLFQTRLEMHGLNQLALKKSKGLVELSTAQIVLLGYCLNYALCEDK